MFDIIADSACDLTPEMAQKMGVEVVPFYVSLDGEHYRKEGKEIAVRDFYQFMVDNPSAYPKTSLASIEDFEEAFRRQAEARTAHPLPLLHRQDERLRGQCPQRPGAGARGLSRREDRGARLGGGYRHRGHDGGECGGHPGRRLHAGRGGDVAGGGKGHQQHLLYGGQP